MSKDDLTIEKLKINERLGALEINMGKVLDSLVELRTHKNEAHAHLENELDTVRHLLYGNSDPEKPGLIIVVDRLKVASGQRAWQMGIVYTVVVGLFVSQIWKVIFH